MMRIAARSRLRFLALVIALVLAQIPQNYAQAIVYLTNYNAQSYDPHYGNYYGEIHAENYNHCCHQRVQAQNSAMLWDPYTITNVRYYFNAGPVFHVFDRNTANCALPFTFDGEWWTNLPSPWLMQKNATCGFFPWSQFTGYNNEVRVLGWTASMNAYITYYGGAEFELQNGDLYWNGPGKVSNDVNFFSNQWTQHDINIPKTWCFDQWGGKYLC